MDVMLEAQRLYAGYGGVPVVRDLNLKVSRGQIVALLGANGAGKTTALLTLAGAMRPQQGIVSAFGRPARRSLQHRARTGLALVADDRSVFRTLTVRENLRLGDVNPKHALNIFPALEPLMDRKVRLLSGGEQQMLGLGRALARKPKVLLADELSLGLAPVVVSQLMQALRQAADQGCAVVLVEQQVRLVLNTCDYAHVLQRGENVLSGTSTELLGRISELERAYLAVPVDTP